MLMGTAAYRRGQPEQAIAEWQKLLAQLEPGTRDHSLVQSYIDQARANADKVVAAKAADGVPAPAAKKGDENAAPGAGAVSGEVVIAPALASKVGPQDTLFIIARAEDGTRMPVAVLRRSANELPFKFTLDDSMAMVPQRTISKAQSLVLVARISKTGQATVQPGDLVSENGTPVKPGATGLRLVIDRQL
jgi:cytochrome c-type biogenesis protein CcmH